MDSNTGHKQTAFKPISQKRVFAEIADQIRQLILSKQLNPGDKLPSERELAIQFKTGRISVREALRTLEQAGFIYIKQGSEGGSFVREADISLISESIYDLIRRVDVNLEDISDIRFAVESLIIQKAIERITKEDLKQLNKIVRESEMILKNWNNGIKSENDLDTLTAANADFHMMLAKISKNVILELFMEILMKFMYPIGTSSIDAQLKHVLYHKEICKALSNKDFDRAMESFRQLRLHFESGLK